MARSSQIFCKCDDKDVILKKKLFAFVVDVVNEFFRLFSNSRNKSVDTTYFFTLQKQMISEKWMFVLSLLFRCHTKFLFETNLPKTFRLAVCSIYQSCHFKSVKVFWNRFFPGIFEKRRQTVVTVFSFFFFYSWHRNSRQMTQKLAFKKSRCLLTKLL